MFGKKEKTEEPQGAVGQLIQEEKAKLNQIMGSINSAMEERDDLLEIIKENSENVELISKEVKAAEVKLGALRVEKDEYFASVSDAKTELSALQSSSQKQRELSKLELSDMTAEIKIAKAKVSSLGGESDLLSKSIFKKEVELRELNVKILDSMEDGRKAGIALDAKSEQAEEDLASVLSETQTVGIELISTKKELIGLVSEVSQLKDDVVIQKDLNKELRSSNKDLESGKKKNEEALAEVSRKLDVETEKFSNMFSKIIAAAQKETRLASREIYLRKLYKDSSIEFPAI